jgi:hypothetical protein
MYASIWWLDGDPDELEQRYDAMIADIPRAYMRLHLCLRAPDGLIVVDTCPSQEAFEGFVQGPFKPLREAHGLPEPRRMDGFPVHAAIVNGDRVEAAVAG